MSHGRWRRQRRGSQGFPHRAGGQTADDPTAEQEGRPVTIPIQVPCWPEILSIIPELKEEIRQDLLSDVQQVENEALNLETAAEADEALALAEENLRLLFMRRFLGAEIAVAVLRVSRLQARRGELT